MKLTIDRGDELTHDPASHEVWRESYWIDVIDDQSGAGILMYCGVRPGQDVGHGFVNIAERDRVLYSFRDYEIPVLSHDGGQNELQIGPFTVVNGKPLETQTFKFENDACKLAIEFESDASVYDYPWPWTRSRHWEQVGRATANATLASGETVSLAGTSARDHAWGLRQLLTWHGFVWITCRAREDGPSWTICWLNTSERRQTLGYLVDPNGDNFIATEMVADVDYDEGVPKRVRLKMEFGGYWHPLEAELDLYGPIDLSSADPDKQGGYFFSFAEGTTNGVACNGTFDIFWREGLEPLARLPFQV